MFQYRQTLKQNDYSAVVKGLINNRTVVKKIVRAPADAVDILDQSMLQEMIGLYRIRSLPATVATEKISMYTVYRDGIPIIQAEMLFPAYTSTLADFNEDSPLASRLSLLPVLARKLITGLKYVHSRGIIHRDIKPSNVLLSYRNLDPGTPDDIIVGLADLGLCTTYINPRNLYSPVVYTRNYRPPEISAQDNFYVPNGSLTLTRRQRSFSLDAVSYYKKVSLVRYDQTADIWALGLTVLEIISGGCPLIGDSDFQDLQYENVYLIRRHIGNLTQDYAANSLTSLIHKIAKLELRDHIHVSQYLDRISPNLSNKVSWMHIQGWDVIPWLQMCLNMHPPSRSLALTRKSDVAGGCYRSVSLAEYLPDTTPQMDVRCMCQPKYYFIIARYVIDVVTYCGLSVRLFIQSLDLCERYLAEYKVTRDQCAFLALVSIDIVCKLVLGRSLYIAELIRELVIHRIMEDVDLLQLNRFTIKLLIRTRFQLIGDIQEFCSKLDIGMKTVAKIYEHYQGRIGELSEFHVNYKYLLDPEHIRQVVS